MEKRNLITTCNNEIRKSAAFYEQARLMEGQVLAAELRQMEEELVADLSAQAAELQRVRTEAGPERLPRNLRFFSGISASIGSNGPFLGPFSASPGLWKPSPPGAPQTLPSILGQGQQRKLLGSFSEASRTLRTGPILRMLGKEGVDLQLTTPILFVWYMVTNYKNAYFLAFAGTSYIAAFHYYPFFASTCAGIEPMTPCV